MNENKTNINWYSTQVSDTNIPNEKKGVFPISEIGNQSIKVRHVCDQSLARCNKNIERILLGSKIERQETIEGKHNQENNKVRTLRK